MPYSSQPKGVTLLRRIGNFQNLLGGHFELLLKRGGVLHLGAIEHRLLGACTHGDITRIRVGVHDIDVVHL